MVHAPAMFMVTEADAAAIRTAFHDEGELPAVIELRQRFPGITDHALDLHKHSNRAASAGCGSGPPSVSPVSAPSSNGRDRNGRWLRQG